jgi:hypothetical protein
MQVTLELNGMARDLARVKMIPLDLPDQAVYRDIVAILRRRYPVLVGMVIDPETDNFLSSNILFINGDLETPAMNLDEHPRAGDHLILISVITGG